MKLPGPPKKAAIIVTSPGGGVIVEVQSMVVPPTPLLLVPMTSATPYRILLVQRAEEDPQARLVQAGPENEVLQRAHTACGFEDAELLRGYFKSL